MRKKVLESGEERGRAGESGRERERAIRDVARVPNRTCQRQRCFVSKPLLPGKEALGDGYCSVNGRKKAPFSNRVEVIDTVHFRLSSQRPISPVTRSRPARRPVTQVLYNPGGVVMPVRVHCLDDVSGRQHAGELRRKRREGMRRGETRGGATKRERKKRAGRR